MQVHDHRNASKDTANTSNPSKMDKNQLYSIHNRNEYLTPSPYVPYPNAKSQNQADSASDLDATKETGSLAKASAADKSNDKENSTPKVSKGPRIYTTVLFPNALTLQEDVLRYASAVDPRSNNRKGSQIGSTCM